MKRLVPMLNGPVHQRILLLPVLLTLVVGLLVVVGCGKDEANVAFPKPIPVVPDPWFFDVWGDAPDNVWVAGARGAMYHFDGADWTLVDMGTDQAITSLYGTGDGSVYACGHGGNIWRTTGNAWSGMSSGTNEDLFRLGSYDSDVVAVGRNGAAVSYDGSWRALPGIMVNRNPKEGNAVTDTMLLGEDVVSLTTVSHYMIGGAMLRPDAADDRVGIEGTFGFTMKDDEPIVDPGPPPVNETGLYDWLVTILGDDPEATPEWVICSHSDDSGELGITNNWYGTSTGWLFRLTQDLQTGKLNWVRYNLLPVTGEERYGVRDLWLAPAADPGAPTDRDLYIVTDDGLIVKQRADGTRETLADVLQALVSIWGTGPDNMYVTGYMDNQILHVNHDPVSGTTVVTPINLMVPEAKANASVSDVDELGRPRF